MFSETLRQFVTYLKKLNIYTVKDEDATEHNRHQLISTRLFLVLFAISFIGLIGYASFAFRSTNVQITNPSQSTFEKLYSIYSQALVCPCSRTSIRMDKFVHSDVSLHQVVFVEFILF